MRYLVHSQTLHVVYGKTFASKMGQSHPSCKKWTKLDQKRCEADWKYAKKTVDCKLWNQASELEVDNGQSVVITNLLTKSWKDEITSSSTDLTNIEVSLYISP